MVAFLSITRDPNLPNGRDGETEVLQAKMGRIEFTQATVKTANHQPVSRAPIPPIAKPNSSEIKRLLNGRCRAPKSRMQRNAQRLKVQLIGKRTKNNAAASA